MTATPGAPARSGPGPQQILRGELLAAEQNTGPRLSPDGRLVAWIRTTDRGQEIWLREEDGTERLMARHHGDSVSDLGWSPDSATLLYRRSLRGREQWTLCLLRTADLTLLTVPAPGPVTEYWTSPARPGSVVYSVRAGTGGTPQLYRFDLLAGGEAELLAVDGSFHRWLVDRSLTVRGGIQLLRDGSLRIVAGHRPDPVRPLLTVGVDDTGDFSVQGFDPDGGSLYVLTGSGAPTRRLLALDWGSGAVTEVFGHRELDIESYPIAGQGVWFDPRSGRPDLCSVMGQRFCYQPLTEPARNAVQRLGTPADRTRVLIDRSLDDRTWLTVDIHDDGPIVYGLFHPPSGTARPVLLNRPGLSGHRMPQLTDFPFTAGDGLPLSGYLLSPASPASAADRPPPLVVLVHGGPAGRDYWRFHAEAQYLASLGYASLHVNYRGSRGFGRAFRLAGNGEWGRRMQQDLYDGVAAAVAAGLADPDRVAFLGGSYGGYSALLAAVARPDLVRCAVAISPLCDLVELVGAPPAYWRPLALMLRRQILGPADSDDAAQLGARSPMHRLDADCAPILVAHGARDPRVPVATVDRFVARAESLDVPVRYLRFPDEGHHVVSNHNRSALFGALSEFLEDHLAVRDPDPAPLHAR